MKKLFTILLTALVAGAITLGSSANLHASDDRTIVIDGSTTLGPIVKAFAEYYMQQNPGVNITVSESGSGNGAKSLVNKACQVAAMSRFMRDTEFKAAVDNGVMPIAHVVALDGLAVVVHPSNPVKDLTIQQVQDIYTGKITNWNQVGGPNQRIVIVSRDTNSGTYETFNDIVMSKAQMASNVEYVGSNGAVKQRVQSTQAAVGYIGLGFVDRTVSAVNINGVQATKANVTSGRYPIARPLYLFTDQYPKLGSHLHSFINLYLTKDGQAMVDSIGFVPVTVY